MVRCITREGHQIVALVNMVGNETLKSRLQLQQRKEGKERAEEMGATVKISQSCSLFMSYYSYSRARPQTQSPGTQ